MVAALQELDHWYPMALSPDAKHPHRDTNSTDKNRDQQRWLLS